MTNIVDSSSDFYQKYDPNTDYYNIKFKIKGKTSLKICSKI